MKSKAGDSFGVFGTTKTIECDSSFGRVLVIRPGEIKELDSATKSFQMIVGKLTTSISLKIINKLIIYLIIY